MRLATGSAFARRRRPPRSRRADRATSRSSACARRAWCCIRRTGRCSRLRASGYIATATKLAHLLEPDAVLERIELSPVDSKGHLVIRAWNRSVDSPMYAYWFSSAARAKAKPGPDDVYMCEVVVEIDTYRGD